MVLQIFNIKANDKASKQMINHRLYKIVANDEEQNIAGECVQLHGIFIFHFFYI